MLPHPPPPPTALRLPPTAHCPPGVSSNHPINEWHVFRSSYWAESDSRVDTVRLASGLWAAEAVVLRRVDTLVTSSRLDPVTAEIGSAGSERPGRPQRRQSYYRPFSEVSGVAGQRRGERQWQSERLGRVAELWRIGRALIDSFQTL